MPELCESYGAIHAWLRKNFPKTGVCDHCGEEHKTQFALRKGEQHRRERAAYLELCRSCHSKYDRDIAVQNGIKGWETRRQRQLAKLTTQGVLGGVA
jgi:hypothetical protein